LGWAPTEVFADLAHEQPQCFTVIEGVLKALVTVIAEAPSPPSLVPRELRRGAALLFGIYHTRDGGVPRIARVAVGADLQEALPVATGRTLLGEIGRHPGA
tara:strand:- start:434 stop:736 length:303 start_codon:yes stop_codon:yes gene_type:complete